ncbi:MAG: hypothetical protein M3N18_01355 [Actinomycetota bacterium]|nr:hypothetical protein [Actinomycetota bacterium]
MLVSPEVAAQLDPEGHYGGVWRNRARPQNKQVSEERQDGEWVYRVRSTTTPRPREEWIAAPVLDPGIPRTTVDAARRAIRATRRPLPRDRGSGNSPAGWPAAKSAAGL